MQNTTSFPPCFVTLKAHEDPTNVSWIALIVCILCFGLGKANLVAIGLSSLLAPRYPCVLMLGGSSPRNHLAKKINK